MLNILVLMAGRGLRFANKGYGVPKPMINVNGKTILQWTTESCPFIKHDEKIQDKSVNLCFAILEEHAEIGLIEYLHSVYGKNITIIQFDKITRGNLETAKIACEKIKTTCDWAEIDSENNSILILDSDNKYNHNGIDSFIQNLPQKTNTMAICCFDDKVKTLPNKWSNARVENGIAKAIKEKDDTWINDPALVGVFYFSKLDEFLNYANFVINELKPLSIKGNEEYYMSMIPTYHAEIGNPVYVHFVDSVISLGTPEDVELFRNSENNT